MLGGVHLRLQATLVIVIPLMCGVFGGTLKNVDCRKVRSTVPMLLNRSETEVLQCEVWQLSMAMERYPAVSNGGVAFETEFVKVG